VVRRGPEATPAGQPLDHITGPTATSRRPSPLTTFAIRTTEAIVGLVGGVFPLVREPPWGIEPQTYALRDSAVADGCRRLVSFNAGSLPHCPWLVGAGYGWRRMGEGISGADECGSGGAARSETSQLRPVLATWQQAPSSGGRTMCPFEGYTPLCDAVGGCSRRRREPLRRQMRPVSWAHMATSTRFRAPSFRMRLARWALTVLGVM
jgi:hypothetical protein